MATPARILMVEGDTKPPSPTAGQILFYAKTSGVFYSLNSAGVETPLGGAAGTVSDVSVTTANGISGVVANSTTTPAITLTLGAITPTSVAATGTLSGSNFSGTFSGTHTGASSGTNTGDQTITLTGDVNGSGTGTFAATLANSGASAGTYGSSSAVPVITVDSKGRITSVTTQSISTGSGTVTSVDVTSANAAITVLGSPITTSGTINLTANNFTSSNPGVVPGSGGGTTNFLRADGTWSAPPGGTGTVTSVAASGGTTGLTFSGSPVTTSGTLTLGGTLAIASGGTGQTTASGAINALVPSQGGNSGKFLTTNGSVVSWGTVSGTGTVTSVAATGNNGITVSGSPITTSGTITLGLGNITPTSVAATGTVTGSNLSGTNTGDQTITLTGDVTGSGTGSFATSLSNTGVTANTYGSATQVPVFTVDAKGRISSVTNTTITGGGGSNTPEIVVWHYSSGGSGNFTAVDALFSQTSGVTATVTDGANCIATYTFTGKSNPPKSIITYGQNFSLNTFNIKDTTSLPGPAIAGGGTSASPDLANGIFSTSNVLTLQTRMSDTGASSTIGNRAWCVVVFGF